jgi:alpha-1,6-mannosyltransferase
LLAASAVLAVVVPPTGADFNFRAFQLPLALAASLVMLAVLVAFQRRQIQGATGVDIDSLPGHAPLAPD